MPTPVFADPATQNGSSAASSAMRSWSPSGQRSSLFSSVTRGLLSRSSSFSTWVTATCCLSLAGLEASTTCTSTSASTTSSRVARKAATSPVGSFWMKPTVSVKSTSGCTFAPGSRTLRVVGSRVANSMFSASTPARVMWFSTVLFPEFVYPTRAMMGMPSLRRFWRCSSRWRRTSSSFSLRFWISSFSSRRSISICVSPGPRRPTPPTLPMPPADWRSRWVHSLVSRGSR
mmetsp:Transcript_24947/g.37455  ORF Transcript_24947/g.37455 Transcript_24947/m.37455 type:complete len:231 (-) Transcript_24947:975-1667(-)